MVAIRTTIASAPARPPSALLALEGSAAAPSLWSEPARAAIFCLAEPGWLLISADNHGPVDLGTQSYDNHAASTAGAGQNQATAIDPDTGEIT